MTGETPTEHDPIPEWATLVEQRRAERAEARRFARAGLGVHESELVRADDPRLAQWARLIPEVK